MSKTKYWAATIFSIVGGWFSLMSGCISIPLAILALFLGGTAKFWFALLAITSLWALIISMVKKTYEQQQMQKVTINHLHEEIAALNAKLDTADSQALLTWSQFFPEIDNGDNLRPALLSVEMANAGERPIKLTILGAIYEDGTSRSMFIGPDDKGVQLNDQDKHSISLSDIQFIIQDPDSGSKAVDLWLEDTLRKKHFITDAKRNLHFYFKAISGKPTPKPHDPFDEL